MAGRRRAQRSVRVTVAAALLGASALVVVVALLSGTFVGAAAVLSMLAGGCAARIVYSEVVQTRLDAAHRSAEQARSFRDSTAANHREHLAFTETMLAGVEQRDARIAGLALALRLTERRADDAETRVKREAQRANDSQERLAALLDEVLGTAGYDVDQDRQGDLSELPAIVDLMRWDSRATA